MTTVLTPDICVIGAGSGGLTVAAIASAFGAPVVLIEKGPMGGDCLNYGCVPSKAMIAAARHMHELGRGAAFGIRSGKASVDFAKVNRHIREVIEAIAPNDSAERFTALGIKVIKAEARFEDRRTVVAGDVEVRARRFVVATGSSPLIPPIPGLDRVPYLTNETLFDLTERPEHLIVIGAGAMGIEMAQAYRRLGSAVTIIEVAEPLGDEDPELVGIVLEAMRAEGVVLRAGTSVVAVEPGEGGGIRVIVEGAAGRETIEGSHLLLATGRKANVDGLDLGKAGIAVNESGIKVSHRLRTTNRRVYAVGDVTGARFTHVAGHQAKLVAKQVLFRSLGRVAMGAVPRVTFCDPELAVVGMTEAEARKAHGAVTVLRWPYAENDRAQAERRTRGHIKLMIGRKGKLLGVGIVGANAAEMIGFWTLALSKGMSLRDVAAHIPPYPTMSEIGKRAAITYFLAATRNPMVRRLVRFLRVFG
ncbi:mercuric reductase [Mesorhizobium sp. L-8-10]|uniref:dihydrolipoyl dehydrogenase family protein n=1 Tax=Mesorhizobium sp. L-8-10 TaxID=2744523 RepID=UPI00192914B9|nr:FAD-dependent oxidoreductase [Mesorhizobium sp. L-8-10]BCH35792.1 mercuric reductase [Mesorhizobium sp. L-8-10]